MLTGNLLLDFKEHRFKQTACIGYATVIVAILNLSVALFGLLVNENVTKLSFLAHWILEFN